MVRPARAVSNPFYVLLMAASTLFVVTVLGYLASPAAMARAPQGRSPMAEWLDRNGPRALGAEFALMLVSGVLAMATDGYFAARPPQ